ncbi:MAG: helix-turn-helix transcriptional regulator [Bradyrhizobium sp.]|uniref:helix-turn-helix domain-containing protein n=1 Tax=Bradyrhizobium sp. TaxID=376 RepID=UPI001A1B6A55|nr:MULTISPECIES: helix-turn-helix transcriptional regulator [Bradyrhizobium]MBJ7402165.1 helix-turn-helix transcriptional regulator [Bradyrhizobium sp.]MBR0926300.1 helix-turn-helix transcriptional regulator [Bradyrhizobium diazoefficiens]
MTTTVLDPKLLGFWARCVREAQHLSQEALAANASVNIRTIQRFEAGQPINVMSRRAVAKALGYKNPDTFEDPQFITGVLSFFDGLKDLQQKGLDDQHPDHVRIDAQPLVTGDAAAHFADVVNAVSFTIDPALTDETKQVAASFCDYVQDLMDVDDFPVSSRLGFAKDLDGVLQELRGLGANVYSATRDRKFRGADWGDKPSWEMTVGYLAIVPADRELTQLYIPRRMKLA